MCFRILSWVFSSLCRAGCFVFFAAIALFAEPLFAQPRQWQPIELTFVAGQDVVNPFDFDEVDFRVEFVGPDQRSMLMPGFWDGDRVWKVRFVPTRPGLWKYRTICGPLPVAGLHGNTGTFTAFNPATTTALSAHGGIVAADVTRPVLTYSDGTPFPWVGDTWWNFPEKELTLDMASKMADQRVGQGFTVYQAHGSRPMVPYGCDGFNSVSHPLDKSLAYWKSCDPYYQLMFQKGLLGVVGLGAHEQWDPYPTVIFQRWFRTHLARFGVYGVTYLFLQEFDIAKGMKDERIVKLRNTARYLYQLDPYARAMSVHPASNSADLHLMWGESWHKFALIQSGHFVPTFPQRYWKLRDDTPWKPIVESEHNYEGFARTNMTIDDTVVRRSYYVSILAESAGFTYGAQGLYANITSLDRPLSTQLWGPVLTWDQGLALPGGDDIGKASKLLKSLNWSSWRSWRYTGGITPTPLVAGDDGETSLVYFFAGAKAVKITAVPDKWIRGPGTATWFDPRTGGRGSAKPFQRTATGWVLPTPPDLRDWVLIIAHN